MLSEALVIAIVTLMTELTKAAEAMIASQPAEVRAAAWARHEARIERLEALLHPADKA